MKRAIGMEWNEEREKIKLENSDQKRQAKRMLHFYYIHTHTKLVLTLNMLTEVTEVAECSGKRNKREQAQSASHCAHKMRSERIGSE